MKLKISVDPRAYIVFSAMLLLLGPNWMCAVIFSAAVHELGHLTALWMYDCKVFSIRILPFGARIDTGWLHGKIGILCALAGPIAGGMLVFAYPAAPKTAFCALVQTLFNLLPIYPLDGGQALRYWLHEKAVAKSLDSSYNTKD